MDTAESGAGAGAGAGSSPPDSFFGRGVAALRAVRRGTLTPQHGRSVSLLACFAGAQLFPPSDPQSMDRLCALVEAGVGAEDGVPEPQVIVTAHSLAAGVLRKILEGAPAPTPTPAAVGEGAGETGPAGSSALVAGTAGAAGGGGGPDAAPSPAAVAGGALCFAVVERLFLPALASSWGRHSLRCLFHKQAADFIQLAAKLGAVPLPAAANLLWRCLGTLVPPQSAFEAAKAASPRALPTLLATGYLQPAAAVWVRPDFEHARASYTTFVASAGLAASGLLDWGAVGLASAAAAPPVPSASPAAGAAYGGLGFTPGSGFASFSPYTPVPPTDLSPGAAAAPATPGAAAAAAAGGADSDGDAGMGASAVGPGRRG